MTIDVERDGRSWDAALLRLDAHPLQSAAWGALKAGFGWQPIRLLSRSGSAAAQLLIRPLFGLAAAYVPRGPVFSGDAETDTALLDEINRQARRHRAAFVRLEPDILEDTDQAQRVDELLRRRRFRAQARTIQPRGSLAVDLDGTEQELMGRFSKGHRADIRRAERDGVAVRVGRAEDAETLHQMLQATQQRKSFAIHSAAYYRAVLESFGNAARLFVAEHDGSPVAASLIIAWGNRGIYLVAGSTREGLTHRAGHLLQWHALRWARERGVRSYDLWGIPDARARLDRGDAQTNTARTQLEDEARNDPLDGIYRFKKGWAASAIRHVPAYDRVYFPPAYWLWQRQRRQSG